jgi:uncharacterized protein (DUF433 family)
MEDMLPTLSRAEKARLLETLVRDLSGVYPGIEQTPGVVGGVARVAGTRVPVWTLIQYQRLGANDAELLRMYPALRAEDLANAWAYARAHAEEIEQQIQANETA